MIQVYCCNNLHPYSIQNQERIFLRLSCCILAGSFITTILFYIQLRRKSYILLEGTCTQVQFKPFPKSYQILLVDTEETEHTLLISKYYKIRPRLSYRFYFKAASGISPDRNPMLEKVFLTDQLLSVEQLSFI